MGPYEWDDFTSSPIDDPYEAWVQSIIGYIEWYYPSRTRRGRSIEWCHPLGGQALERLANAIETETFPYPPTEEEKYELDHDKIPDRYRGIFFGDCDPGVSMTNGSADCTKKNRRCW